MRKPDKSIRLERHEQTDKHDKYNYCPYCLSEFKKNNHDEHIKFNDVLPVIVYNKFLNIWNENTEEEHRELDIYWECPKCSRHLEERDYELFFTLKSDGTRKKPEDLWSPSELAERALRENG